MIVDLATTWNRFFKADPRQVYSDIAVYAFATYGIIIESVNFDTTSKMLYGQYRKKNGEKGVISITFGHSKNGIKGKKQIKIGVGAADGVLADAEVLSGNKDDKEYNYDKLDEMDDFTERFSINNDTFHYIADSSLFTYKNVKKANKKGIKIISRVPETNKEPKQLIEKAWAEKKKFQKVVIETTQKEASEYLIQQIKGTYKGFDCNYTVYYSEKLRAQKEKTLQRAANKEKKKLDNISKEYKKEEFHCQKDAQREIHRLMKKELKSPRFYTVEPHIVEEEQRGVGRPKKNKPESEKTYIYKVDIQVSPEPIDMENILNQSSTFVLGSNNMMLMGEEMLREYKTQSSVENKFSQLKSPQFVHTIFLENPNRIVAFTYLLLIVLLSLSVIEKVVRRSMGIEKETIIGPGRVILKKPSLRAILDIFINVTVNETIRSGVIQRRLSMPLNASQKKILRYIGLTENIFLKADLEGFFAQTVYNR